MSDAFHQIILGIGALILAPANTLPPPGFRITLPPQNATTAIGRDFSSVSRHLRDSIEKVEHAEQLELDV